MSAARNEAIQRSEISLRVGAASLAAELVLPANAAAVVLHALFRATDADRAKRDLPDVVRGGRQALSDLRQLRQTGRTWP